MSMCGTDPFDDPFDSVKTETAEQVLPGGTDKELRSGSAAVSEIKV